VADGLQAIRVPAVVTPRAPLGLQKAPGCTPCLVGLPAGLVVVFGGGFAGWVPPPPPLPAVLAGGGGGVVAGGVGEGVGDGVGVVSGVVAGGFGAGPFPSVPPDRPGPHPARTSRTAAAASGTRPLLCGIPASYPEGHRRPTRRVDHVSRRECAPRRRYGDRGRRMPLVIAGWYPEAACWAASAVPTGDGGSG
jgi:hypothetical protein